MSRKADADALLKMIKDCFIQKPILIKFPENWKILQENYINRFKGHQTKNNNMYRNLVRPTEFKQEVIIRNTLSFDAVDKEFAGGILKYIFLYPVKSCGAFAPPKSWKVSNSGLEYDRKWMIVNSNGSCLSQKQNPNMCLVRPVIDLEQTTLELSFPGKNNLVSNKIAFTI